MKEEFDLSKKAGFLRIPLANDVWLTIEGKVFLKHDVREFIKRLKEELRKDLIKKSFIEKTIDKLAGEELK